MADPDDMNDDAMRDGAPDPSRMPMDVSRSFCLGLCHSRKSLSNIAQATASFVLSSFHQNMLRTFVVKRWSFVGA